eukprot:5954498-Pyramimonas_sp.AAC.2
MTSAVIQIQGPDWHGDCNNPASFEDTRIRDADDVLPRRVQPLVPLPRHHAGHAPALRRPRGALQVERAQGRSGDGGDGRRRPQETGAPATVDAAGAAGGVGTPATVDAAGADSSCSACRVYRRWRAA